MKKIYFLGLILFVLVITSCTTYNKVIREPNVRVEFNKSDFVLSDQFTAEESSTKIFYIDFGRLFLSKSGDIVKHGSFNFANVPVIGNAIMDRTANYALYQLLKENPGYDVILYPQYEIKIVKPILGLGFLTTYTKVKVTARLGKLKD